MRGAGEVAAFARSRDLPEAPTRLGADPPWNASTPHRGIRNSPCRFVAYRSRPRVEPAALERVDEERGPALLRLVPLDDGDLVVERDAVPDDRLPPNDGRGLEGERTEGEVPRDPPVVGDPIRDLDGLYPPPELRLRLGVRICGDVRLVDGEVVARLREPVLGDEDGRRLVLAPRDPVEGTRELEGSLAFDPRVAPLPKGGPVRPVAGRRIEPEPELLGRVADPTRDRLRGTNTPLGAVVVAPVPGDAVRLPIVAGRADGRRRAAVAGVPLRFVRELPTRGTGFVAVPLLAEPLGIVLRDDRLRAPMTPDVRDWPPIAGVAGEVGRGAVRELLLEVFNAPIRERALGTKTPGAVVRRVFARRVPAPGAEAAGRAVRTLADRARTLGFAGVAGTALVPLARWLRIAGETPVRFVDGTTGLAAAPRVPAAADDRAAGLVGRVESLPAADRTLVPALARAAGFLYVVRKSAIEFRKRSCWDSNDTRAVPSRKANERSVRSERKAEPLAAGAWTNLPWLERAGTTGTGPRIATPLWVFAIRRLRGVCWTPRPKSWALTYETPR